jgi:hypothetical protein
MMIDARMRAAAVIRATTRKTAVAAAGACLITAGSAASIAHAVSGPRFSANYPLISNTPDPSADVPGLAVDPGNQSHIVEANIDPINLQCDYHVSFDGGRTWAGGHLQAPSGSATPPFPTPACNQNFDSGGYAHFNAGIAFGSGQNVYVTFSIHRGPFNRPENPSDGGNGDDAVVAHSADGGKTFQPAVVAVPGGGPTSLNPGLAGYGMRPQVAVQRGAGTNGQDRVYVDSWNCYIRIRASQTSRGGCSGGGGDRRIFVARSDDGGTTWAPPVLASAANVRTGTVIPPTGAAGEAGSTDEQAVEPAQPVIGPDGAVYVAYKNRDITDGTTCPSNPSITGTAPGGFTRTKARCVVVARSTNQGQSWQQFSTLPIGDGSLVNPRLAIDPSVGTRGELYVVFRNKVGSDPADIQLQRSVDGGQTWSAPVRVNNDPPGAVQTNPWVSVGAPGHVYVIWNDRRHPYPGGSMGDIYYASSTDGGVTFPTNRRVTDRTINVDTGRYGDVGENFSTGFDWYGPTLLPLANGHVLAAWTDSRRGNVDSGFQDVFLSDLNPAAEMTASGIATATTSGLSVQLSRLAYPGGPEALGGNPITKVVVVNQGDVAGALAGAVLARANWGPLLLSPASGLPGFVKAEAARMVPEGGYVIGDKSMLSTTVSHDLLASTRNGENVQRVAAAGTVPVEDRPAEVARQIAGLLPRPSSEAVIANPGSPDAAAASALAAALELPILFVDTRTALPDPTSQAIASLGIKKALIIGGLGSVNAGVEASLVSLLGGVANVKRLGGADQYATSQAVLAEAVARGLPTNLVYVADGNRPIDGAVLGSAVARLGGLMLLMPGANPGTAELTLDGLGIGAGVDRVLSARGIGGRDPASAPPPRVSCTLSTTRKVSLTGPGKGRLTVLVRCNQDASLTLRGVLHALAGKPPHATPFKLGPVKTMVHAGVLKSVTLKLPTGALKRLGQGAKETVVTTLTAANLNGVSRIVVTGPRLRAG